MSDVNTSQSDNPQDEEDDGAFHTDTAAANAAMQRGQGVGAAELAAQRDPGANPTSPADDLPLHAPDDVDDAETQ